MWRLNGNIADLHIFVDPAAGRALRGIVNEDGFSIIEGPNIFIRTDFDGLTLSQFVFREAKALLKLPLEPHNVNGRHLCDFRPLFGEIFKPYLRRYTHWAWVDEETHVGSIQRWLSRAELSRFHIVSFLGHSFMPKKLSDPWYQLYTRGPLTVLANTPSVNTAWRWIEQSKLEKTFLNDKNNNMDEYHYTHGVALRQSGLAVMFLHQGPDFKHKHEARIEITADAQVNIRAWANCKDCDQAQLFADLCKLNNGGLQKLDNAMIESSGYWSGHNIPAKHVGLLKYFRKNDGQWWSEATVPEICQSKVKDGEHPLGIDNMIDLPTAEYADGPMNISYPSTFMNRRPDLGPLTLLYCSTTEGADDNPSHAVDKNWNMVFWRNHYDSVLLPWDEAPDPLPPRTIVIVPQTISELKGCQKHPLYIKAKRMQREAKSLEALGVTPPSGWTGALHFQNRARMRTLAGRPMVMGILGEVFWAPAYGPNDDFDIMMYRSRERPRPGCVTAHFLQAVTHGYRQEYIKNTVELNRTSVFNVLHEQDWTRPIPPKFCQLQTMAVLHRARYFTDSLVRWATLRKLSNQYKPVEYIGYLQSRRAKQMRTIGEQCNSKSWNQTACMAPYKFSIVMENTQENGYVSEKLFNGYLAGSVPIYFGAPDVLRYLNPEAFVWCNVSRAAVMKMREFYPQAPGTTKIMRYFTFKGARGEDDTFDGTGFDSPKGGDGQLIDWAAEFYNDELQTCVDQIKRLDADDTAYVHMRSQPLVLDRNILTGRSLAEGFDQLFKLSGL
jgi:hypothetical protein